MRVVIHADASPSMGTGHVIRSLAAARALRDAGVDVTLASTALDAALIARARSTGVAVVDRLDASRDPSWIVVDGYHLTARIRRDLADPAVPRLVIDDLGEEVSDAALVVNQNLYGREVEYPDGPEILAGPTYALLRPEFGSARPDRNQPAVADRVLVTLGGADPHNATALAVSALSSMSPAPEVRVILGLAHPDAAGVTRAAHGAGFEFIRDAPTLQPHLAWCDLVISGCGTSVLEAARLGRPIIGIVLAENQRRVAQALVREGLGTVVGAHPGIGSQVLREAVERLRHDRDARTWIAAHGPELVDGRGAARVAKALLSGAMRLRRAELSDAERLLAWRNDPTAREASFAQAPIEPAVHRAWLEERLADPAHHVFVGDVGGTSIGVVRFAVDQDVATISVVLAPEARGRGLGTRLVSLGCTRLRRASTVAHVDASIRVGNGASASAFAQAGFRIAEVSSDRVRMRLTMRPVG